MNSAHLSPLNEAINVPGVVFTRNAVLFEKRQPIERLIALAKQAAGVGRSMAWFLGDIGLEIQEHARRSNADQAEKNLKQAEQLASDPKGNREKIRDLRADAQRLKEDSGESFRASYSGKLDIDDGYWRNCVMHARFFPPSTRNEPRPVTRSDAPPQAGPLLITHYAVAMKAAGGAKGSLAKAQAWLEKAASHGWTPSELRKQVNLSLATAHPPSTPSEVNHFAALDAADAWAITNGEREIDPAHAPTLRTRWAALIAFLKKLEGASGAPE